MTAPAVALVVVGAATVTSWLLKAVDAIDVPAGRRRRNEL